jgi:pyruvate formate lyase activating enzyme
MSTDTNLQLRGLVFDIERFATKDGPGIRTVVFLKGCHLHCLWCQNPESQRQQPEIMYDASKCAGCGRCMEACPQHAIRKDTEFGTLTDSDLCRLCCTCVEYCYYDARKLVGNYYTPGQLMDSIRRDKPFFDNSQGGVTFSGGEPLLQKDFLLSVCKACREEEIHTAVETCGHVRWQTFADLLPYLDLVYFDLKHIDPELHKDYTGVSNDLILANLEKLSRAFQPLVVRIPVIPGYNDAIDVQRRMYTYLMQNLTRLHSVELLPFHRLGSGKYRGLGKRYIMEEVESLRTSDLQHLQAMGKQIGLQISIGSI